nr:hypothetical protein [Mycoplasmopsis bovis]
MWWNQRRRKEETWSWSKTKAWARNIKIYYWWIDLGKVQVAETEIKATKKKLEARLYKEVDC